jgi:predicted deacylase
MKATKKQIAEVTAKAIEMNADVNACLATLERTSLAMFNVIGAQGIVEASEKSREKVGGYKFEEATIIRETEKAYLVEVKIDLGKFQQSWVAKSTIKNGIIPFWAIK